MRRVRTVAIVVPALVFVAAALRAAPPAAAAEAPVDKASAAKADAEAGAEKPAAAAPDKTLVLDRMGYFNQFTEYGLMRIDAGLLKSEGSALFGSGLGRLKRTVRRLLRPKNIDWEKTDWRDVAVYHFGSIQTGDDSLAISLLPTEVPAPDWAEVGFDDSSFLRTRPGTLSPVTPDFGAARERSSSHRRGLYVRTYFEVPDPAAAGDMTVKVVFRGGARVLVNGTEIARAFLPDGPVGPAALAAHYPAEAYRATPEERHPRSTDFVGDLRCAYEHGARHFRFKGEYRTAYGNMAAVNRAGWERLMKLRDRVLGPVAIPARLLRRGRNVLAIQLRSATYHPLIVPGAGGGRSLNWSLGGANGNVIWDHLRLVDVELRCPSGAVPPANRRPPGMRAWVQDMHDRLFTPDFNPPGWPAGTVRFVGAGNGSFSAQVGVSAGQALTGFKATVGDLAGPGGATIPASAVKVNYMIGTPVGRMSELGWFRSFQLGGPGPMGNVALWRYADRDGDIYHGATAEVEAAYQARKLDGPTYRRKLAEALEKFYDGFRFFDEICPQPPEAVPADSCQPLWLTLKVPAGAAPGKYTGRLTIAAAGQTPVTIPLEAEVIGWRVPDPQQFQMFVQSEQSPYGVAKAYGVELWSDRHFELMGTSFRQLGRIGNKWVFVPVLLHSELGNRDDGGPIRWLRRPDGTGSPERGVSRSGVPSLGFDYALLDRYLALAAKHMGRPEVVCFLIMHGCESHSNAVKVLNVATGKEEVLELGRERAAARKPVWRAFAARLLEHMEALGLRDAVFWGHAFDDTHDPALVALMGEIAPAVGWAAGSHARRPDPVFRAVAAAMGPDLTPRSMQGWRNPLLFLLMPRTGGSIICVEGVSTPFTWRVMCDRTIYCGMNGLGRMGADYFGRTWWDGCRAGGWHVVGRCCTQTLWPGPAGVDSGARNEAMLEGVQEAEARIFMEQALARGVLPEELARRTQQALDDHYRRTLHIGAGGVDYVTMDDHGDWQGASRRLYSAAAAVADRIGLDVDRIVFGQARLKTFHGREGGQVREKVTGDTLALPALGRRRLTLKLRNWSDKPRAFKAVADEPWIAPEKTSGQVAGQQPLGIILDGKTLEAGRQVAGTLTITDVAAGTRYPVRIHATVTEPFELRLSHTVRYRTGGGSGARGPHEVKITVHPVLNVQAGGADSRQFLLVNHTAAGQEWKIDSSEAWLRVAPASGFLDADSSLTVKVTARPDEPGPSVRQTALRLTAAGGAVDQSHQVTTYVTPPYRRPAVPAGQAVYLNDLDQKASVASHVELGGDPARGKGKVPCYHRSRSFGENLNPKYGYSHNSKQFARDPFTMHGKRYARGLWVAPHHETVYRVAGAGFKAFAAEVGFFDGFARHEVANKGALVAFEVHVDGALRVSSGIMGVKDAPRLLVVDGLADARQVKLVTRRDDHSSDETCLATWGDPRFIKGP